MASFVAAYMAYNKNIYFNIIVSHAFSIHYLKALAILTGYQKVRD